MHSERPKSGHAIWAGWRSDGLLRGELKTGKRRLMVKEKNRRARAPGEKISMTR